MKSEIVLPGHSLASPPVPLDCQAIAQTPISDPLLGAFPALATSDDDTLLWAKQLWEQALEKQIQIIHGERS